VQNHLVAGALSYRAAIGSMPFQVGAQYSWDYISLGARLPAAPHRDLVRDAVENKGNLTTLLARFKDKDFFATPGSSGRGPRRQEWMIGGPRLPLREDRHYIRVGYQSTTRTRRADYTYAGNRFLAGGQYTLRGGRRRLNVRLRLHQRHYQHAQHAAARSESGHPGARGPRAEPRVPDREVLAKNPGATSIAARATAPCPLTLAADTSGRSRTPTWRSSPSPERLVADLSWQY